MSELKPCPFCGGRSEIFVMDTDAIALMPKVLFYKVGCAKCNVFTANRDISDAIKAWNRRAE